ncbi:hypothetical protein ACE6H2_007970 [Prunus campanulata]
MGRCLVSPSLARFRHEGGKPDNYFRHNDVVDTENLLRHKRFVNNILAKCLEYRQKHNKQKDVLDKLKIHMERYSAKDESWISASEEIENTPKGLDRKGSIMPAFQTMLLDKI